ncbi:MAG: sugar ABC transporter permease [Herpetosiphon sp.]
MSQQVVPQPVRTVQRSRFSAPSGKEARSQERLGWILMTPTMLVVLVVAFYPLVRTFLTSFTNARLGSTRTPSFVGIENYTRLLSDQIFISSIWHTLVFTLFAVFFETLLGLGIALVIHSNFKGRGLVRTAMLIPWAIPTVVSAQMWAWMYNDVFGVVNDLLVTRLHILSTKIAWAANPSTALGAIVAVDVWKTTPFMALLLLAGLQVIPEDIYEAATVDGANKWQQFVSMTLPLLKPAMLVALIFRTLDSLRVFDVIFVMKQYATETISMAVYARQKMIDLQRIGEGSAISVVIFLILALFVAMYIRFVRVEEA